MLNLMDIAAVRKFGAKKFLLLLSLATSLLFLALFCTVSVLIDGGIYVDKWLLLSTLPFGFMMVALFGRQFLPPRA